MPHNVQKSAEKRTVVERGEKVFDKLMLGTSTTGKRDSSALSPHCLCICTTPAYGLWPKPTGEEDREESARGSGQKFLSVCACGIIM